MGRKQNKIDNYILQQSPIIFHNWFKIWEDVFLGQCSLNLKKYKDYVTRSRKLVQGPNTLINIPIQQDWWVATGVIHVTYLNYMNEIEISLFRHRNFKAYFSVLYSYHATSMHHFTLHRFLTVLHSVIHFTAP